MSGGHADLGMTHGISGPLALLALAMRRGVTVAGHAAGVVGVGVHDAEGGDVGLVDALGGDHSIGSAVGDVAHRCEVVSAQQYVVAERDAERQLVRRCASRSEGACTIWSFCPLDVPPHGCAGAVDVTADGGFHPLLFCIQPLEMPRPFCSSSTANLRCEIAFFCSLDISANVRSLPDGTKMES